MDLQWWITMIELPALVGLFWLIQGLRVAHDDALASARDDLNTFKLHVATNYASLVALKEVEARLTAHLMKIDAKLDRVFEPRAPPQRIGD